MKGLLLCIIALLFYDLFSDRITQTRLRPDLLRVSMCSLTKMNVPAVGIALTYEPEFNF